MQLRALVLSACLIGVPFADAQTQPAEPTTQPMSRRARRAAAAAAATQKAVEQPPAAELSLDDVVKQLMDDSNDLVGPENRFHLQRPHPAVARLQPGQVPAVLERLAKPIADDDARDTYIRYHLMYAVMADANSKKDFKPAQFSEIAAALADELKYDAKTLGSHRYEPPELYARYRKLVLSCRTVTGFPPFQKTVSAPESFEFMDAARRKEAEAAWAEAQSILPKLKRVNTAGEADARVFNQRMGYLSWMLRQTRGETLIGRIMCGDPKQLAAVVSEINQAAMKDPDLASDMLTFFNAAHLDGQLSLYEGAKLKEQGAALQRGMVAADAAQKAANKPAKDFADRAFAVTNAMETGTVIVRGPSPVLKREREMLPPLRARAATPENITLAMIDDAIERGVASLARYTPPDADLGNASWRVSNGSDRPRNSAMGHQSLAVWSMVEAGESSHALWLQKRAFHLALIDSNSTYDRALRLQALSQLPMSRWQTWLSKDVSWLGASMTDKGSFNASGTGAKGTGFGDNANSQYALLGLWAAQRGGMEVPPATWKSIDTYWREAQFPAEKGTSAAGWAVKSYKSLGPNPNMNDFANRVVGPMTAAGVLSLSITERYTVGPKMLGVGNRISPELAKGLDWLDKNYDINDIDGDSDLYYYLWTIQNVGQASGYRTLNQTDWFRQATARLLNEQQAGGTWKGPKGEVVSTSFALLYLARARGPLAICKVRFDAGDTRPGVVSNAWNNRPNDMVNFAEQVSRDLEVPTSWQIADLTQPVHELIESTLLYLATDKAFTLPPEQVDRLREYIRAGGLLVMVPEGGNLAVPTKSMKSLAQQLFPDQEMKKLDAKHAFYTLAQKVQSPPPVSSVDNSIRPLVVLVEKDIGRDLQADSMKQRDSFSLLTNIYLYASGMNAKRPRIQSNFVVASAEKPRQSAKVARIQYAGDFDPEPMAWPQLKALAAGKPAIDLQIAPIKPADLKDEKLAFLTITARGKLAADEAAAVRKWIDAGGALWMDIAGGDESLSGEAVDALKSLGFDPGALKPAVELPVITGKDLTGGFDNTSPSYRTGSSHKPRLEVILQNEKPAVYFTRGDVTSGLAGINHWKINGFSVESTRQMVVNTVLQHVPPPPATKKAKTAK